MDGFLTVHATRAGGHGNLVIATVGDRSCHDSWMAGPGPRPFDVMLVHYGTAAACDFRDAEYTARRQGFKYHLLADVVDAHGDLLAGYARIWCPDDDIRASAATVGRMFDVVRERGFDLAQPAIAAGAASYALLRRVPDTAYRLTPFVEVMCPVFTRAAFLRVAPLFRQTHSGWGIDCVWSTWFPRERMAIIDETGIEHAGRLGRGDLYRRLAAQGIRPEEECEALVARLGGLDRRMRKRLARGRVRLPGVPLSGSPLPAPGMLARLRTGAGRAGR